MSILSSCPRGTTHSKILPMEILEMRYFSNSFFPHWDLYAVKQWWYEEQTLRYVYESLKIHHACFISIQGHLCVQFIFLPSATVVILLQMSLALTIIRVTHLKKLGVEKFYTLTTILTSCLHSNSVRSDQSSPGQISLHQVWKSFHIAFIPKTTRNNT